MKLVNLTPHAINLCNAEGGTLETIPPSGTVARVAETAGRRYDYGLPCLVVGPAVRGEIEGLPTPAEGVAYIVSGMVAAACARADVLSPGTGPQDNPVRDAQGRILGVRVLKASAAPLEVCCRD